MSKIAHTKGHNSRKTRLGASLNSPNTSLSGAQRKDHRSSNTQHDPEILPPEETSPAPKIQEIADRIPGSETMSASDIIPVRSSYVSGSEIRDIDIIPNEVVQVEDEYLEDDTDSNLDEQLIKFGTEISLGEDEQDSSEVALPPVLAETAPSTTLDAYLREIRKYPILNKEEEHALALKVFHDNDRDAAYKLITSNLRLAVKIARDYERAAKNLMDLIQEGNIGLIDAVKNFDPYREVRFPSYAIWWIKAYIIRYVMANWRMVKIGTTQAQRRLFFNLKKERDKLEREGFTPRADILAQRLNVKEQEVIEMEQRLNGADMSVDAPLPADPETNLLALLPAEQKTAEEILEDKEFSNLFINSLKDFEATLNPKELAILKNRLLREYEDQATLKELASQLSITHERVRQIEVRVKEKLKKYLLEHMGSALQMR